MKRLTPGRVDHQGMDSQGRHDTAASQADVADCVAALMGSGVHQGEAVIMALDTFGIQAEGMAGQVEAYAASIPVCGDFKAVLNAVASQDAKTANRLLNTCLARGQVQADEADDDGAYGLSFDLCTWITTLKDAATTGPSTEEARLSVDGSLSLFGCVNLVELPEQIWCDGDLNLSGCARLEQLPDYIRCRHGSLWLGGCVALTSIPEGISVEETLCLDGCTSLEVLPEGLDCNMISLAGCKGLQRLPATMRADDLDLRRCDTWDGVLPEGAVVRNIRTDAYPNGVSGAEWWAMFPTGF